MTFNNFWSNETANDPGPNGITYGEVWRYIPFNSQWENISPPNSGGGFGGISCSSYDSSFVIVTTFDRWRPSDEIYRSFNGGLSWV